jgi:predicted anti-sigma-YlaC factor YlaD
MNAADRYAEWDAAYVLGSLSSAERHEYEQHLARCPRCQAAVAELAALPGLLARVPADDVAAEAEGAVPGALLPNLVHAVARRRRRIRIAVAAAVAVAAAIAIVVPLVVTGPLSPPPEQASGAVTLSQVVASPLQAEIRLVENHWGTRIDMSCRYRGVASDYGAGATQYAMWVTDDAGSAAQVATWTASPGDTAEPSATTSLPIAQIRSVEVRAVESGTVLLRSAPLSGAE